MMRDIYISSNLDQLTKFATSSRSTKFKDILPRNISQMITKTLLISMRIVVTSAMKRMSPFESERNSMETETKTYQNLPKEGKATAEQILASEEK